MIFHFSSEEIRVRKLVSSNGVINTCHVRMCFCELIVLKFLNLKLTSGNKLLTLRLGYRLLSLKPSLNATLLDLLILDTSVLKVVEDARCSHLLKLDLIDHPSHMGVEDRCVGTPLRESWGIWGITIDRLGFPCYTVIRGIEHPIEDTIR